MPRFAANLTMLFTDLPFEQRFAAAAAAGFKAVEYLFPYDYEPSFLAELLTKHGLTQVLFNLPSGDWSKGDRGIAADPARVEEFRAGVDKAILYAKALGVRQLNCLAGKTPQGDDVDAPWSALVANVRYAADILAGHGLTLLLECINRYDIPGFYLHKTAQAAQVIEEAARPNVRLQFDVYHAQREEGELTATLRRFFPSLAHIQIADNPGRHQPGTGEINYRFLFQELDRLDYQGFVGLEYIPQPDTLASLTWIDDYGYSL